LLHWLAIGAKPFTGKSFRIDVDTQARGRRLLEIRGLIAPLSAQQLLAAELI
jgi:hypothetical protein